MADGGDEDLMDFGLADDIAWDRILSAREEARPQGSDPGCLNDLIEGGWRARAGFKRDAESVEKTVSGLSIFGGGSAPSVLAVEPSLMQIRHAFP
jgi:hypothetical protein